MQEGGEGATKVCRWGSCDLSNNEKGGGAFFKKELCEVRKEKTLKTKGKQGVFYRRGSFHSRQVFRSYR